MHSEKWNQELMIMLDKIRINSIYMSEKHRVRFVEFKEMSKYFDLPIIICSVFSSSFGSLNSVPSSQTQLITTSISMFIAVLSSLKLYLNLNNSLNEEISLSKDFYIMSVQIFKVMNLKEEDRGCEPVQFLNEMYSHYIKLIEQSSLLRKNIKKDELTKIDINKYMSDSSTGSFSTLSSDNSPKNIIITTSTQV
jgi:hypothetical protein